MGRRELRAGLLLVKNLLYLSSFWHNPAHFTVKNTEQRSFGGISDYQKPSWGQNPLELAKRLLGVFKVFQHAHTHDQIKRFIGKRQITYVTLNKVHITDVFFIGHKSRVVQYIAGVVQSHNLICVRRNSWKKKANAASNIYGFFKTPA